MADIEAHDTLTPPQHKAIAALLTEPTVRKAAEVAGVKERTVYNWLKQSAFQAEYRVARSAAVQQAIARLQQFSGSAAATLVSLMASGNPAPIRLAAASKVIDLAVKTVELEDLRDELERLRAMIRDRLGDDTPEL